VGVNQHMLRCWGPLKVQLDKATMFPTSSSYQIYFIIERVRQNIWVGHITHAFVQAIISMSRVLWQDICLNPWLIQPQTPYPCMFFNTNASLWFIGWQIQVCAQFSPPDTNIGLIFDPSPNNNSMIGINLNYVIDDQMLLWNFEANEYRNW
jgi:hypothetical protein